MYMNWQLMVWMVRIISKEYLTMHYIQIHIKISLQKSFSCWDFSNKLKIIWTHLCKDRIFCEFSKKAE